MVDFDDGAVERFTENIIARNIFSQVGTDGHDKTVIKEFVDYRVNRKVVTKENGFVVTQRGTRRPNVTTSGWDILLEFNNRSTDWIPLKDLKNSNQIEIAEYAVANRIANEPALIWWVPHVLRKRNRIINKVKGRYWRTTHKFGVRVPKSVQDAFRIDRDTGTTFWTGNILKEMKKGIVAFEIIDGFTPEEIRDGKCDMLKGFQEIGRQMIFDMKMTLTRKARLVAGGHTTVAPSSITCSSVVSRDSVRIAFIIAGIN